MYNKSLIKYVYLSMLNTRQQRFTDEYLIDSNGTAAAIRAGYSKRSAKMQASRLMSNDVQ